MKATEDKGVHRGCLQHSSSVTQVGIFLVNTKVIKACCAAKQNTKGLPLPAPFMF